MMKRALAVALLASFAGVHGARALDAAAKAPIEALDQALLTAMHEGKATPFAQRYAQLAPVVERTFDLDTILQTSIGPRWQTFTPAQQDAVKAEFLRFTVASYVANFSSYTNEAFDVLVDGRTIGSDQVVETKIASGATTNRIDYVMREQADGWRAVDVLLDGSISHVAVQRSDFRKLVESGPDPLIESLRKKVRDLSGGTGVP